MTQTLDIIGLLEETIKIPGLSGEERAVRSFIEKTLQTWGLSPDRIQVDDCPKRMTVPCSTGNLFVRLEGTRPGPRILISSHMDTVPLCAGAEPVRDGRRLVPKGKTALGGDNRTGVAAMLVLLHAILKEGCQHPPLTFLFTIREESGLQGARHLDPKLISDCAFGINIDGGSPWEGTIAAVGANRFFVDLHGKASHAGVYPERGISSLLIASMGLARVHQGGWFGKVIKGEKQGSSNIGYLGDAEGRSAGSATNVVTDFVRLKGEARSMDPVFKEEITAAYREAFAWAASQVKDHEGNPGKVEFHSETEYTPFELPPGAPVVRLYEDSVKALGQTPVLKKGRGGLDANWLHRHGVPALTLGAGQNQIHAVGEWVNLDHFESACALLRRMVERA